MNKLNLDDVTQYVENHIGEFHDKRLAKVNNIKLKDVLKAKNPYMFKAKNVTSASQIIDGILSAYISSSEEGIFGNWLERLAIFINQKVYNGQKAAVDGIDLDFNRDGVRYLVAIKSGPKWGNDSQIKKLIDQFSTARRRLATSGAHVQVVCVNGCCYGQSRQSSEYKAKGDYYKMCGQRFWELISGEADLYIKLIEPLGHEAEEKNQAFLESYNNLKNRLEREFLNEFTAADGSIDWAKLVRLNSSFG
ncbi:cytosolic protein [Parapedobacter sp. ISTM3]|uniref:PmeII family type II restriction endonuclease n=1 Tax=Parapedobacter sp. ISTM3 TaxID=2800130 RepID=UPI00190356EB|nr:PmeII family type II restriction endonuclease [Parapedobacter sp. ISTM3]MBK1442757.1 cytosolic protein [Parapedobacter sp. ISTM3]